MDEEIGKHDFIFRMGETVEVLKSLFAGVYFERLRK